MASDSAPALKDLAQQKDALEKKILALEAELKAMKAPDRLVREVSPSS